MESSLLPAFHLRIIPLVSAMGVSGLSSALAEGGPSQIDIMREQQLIDDEDRARRDENTDVSGITLPKYRQNDLTFKSTGEKVFTGGLINGRRLST